MQNVHFARTYLVTTHTRKDSTRQHTFKTAAVEDMLAPRATSTYTSATFIAAMQAKALPAVLQVSTGSKIWLIALPHLLIVFACHDNTTSGGFFVLEGS